MRKPLVHSRFGCPVAIATVLHAIEPTVKTTNPQPVTRGPRLAAVIIAAIIVAIGAIQPGDVFHTSVPSAPAREIAPRIDIGGPPPPRRDPARPPGDQRAKPAIAA